MYTEGLKLYTNYTIVFTVKGIHYWYSEDFTLDEKSSDVRRSDIDIDS